MRYLTFILSLVVLASCGGHKAVTRADYERELRRELPFAVDTFYRVSDDCYAFATRLEPHVQPDYRQQSDGSFYVVQNTLGQDPVDLQPADEIWRNLVVSPGKGRVMCVDRIVKDGKYGGYAYVLQNDDTPHGTVHWDVTRPENLQAVGHALDVFLSNTRILLEGRTDSLRAPANQDEYWDLIFMVDTTTNLAVAERILDLAFTHDRYILPCHLTIYADKMAYGGNRLVSDRYQRHRIAMESDYYDQYGTYSEVVADTFAIRQARYSYNLGLKTELEYMMEQDQHHRLQWSHAARDGQDSVAVEKLAQRALQTDSINLACVKEILASSGYPRRSEVGEMAAMAVWLVVQHAPLDDQREMLPALEAAAASGEIDKAYVATLHDRIDVREGRPQRYGTQRDAQGDVCPLLDEGKVNDWRREVGLPPLMR